MFYLNVNIYILGIINLIINILFLLFVFILLIIFGLLLFGGLIIFIGVRNLFDEFFRLGRMLIFSNFLRRMYLFQLILFVVFIFLVGVFYFIFQEFQV